MRRPPTLTGSRSLTVSLVGTSCRAGKTSRRRRAGLVPPCCRRNRSQTAWRRPRDSSDLPDAPSASSEPLPNGPRCRGHRPPKLGSRVERDLEVSGEQSKRRDSDHRSCGFAHPALRRRGPPARPRLCAAPRECPRTRHSSARSTNHPRVGRRHRAELAAGPPARRPRPCARAAAKDAPQRRSDARQPRGHPLARRRLQVRRRQHRRLLRLPGAALGRRAAEELRLRPRQPGEQPLDGLRAVGQAPDDRRAASGRGGVHRPARADHDPARQGTADRLPRLRALRLRRRPARHPGRQAAGPAGARGWPPSSS